MAKKTEKEVVLQQTVQKTEIVAQTKTFRKNIICSLTLDNSESMNSKKREVLTAAQKIFDKLEDHDRLEFAVFGKSYYKVHGPKKKKFIRWQEDADKFDCSEDMTALHNSICDAIDQFPRDSKFKDHDKAMIVLTDGEDNARSVSFEQMIAKLKSFKIPNCKFYLIGVELSERASTPYRQISNIPNCTYLEANEVSQIATTFKQISKTIFMKRTTTVQISSPSIQIGYNNNNNNNNNRNIGRGENALCNAPQAIVTQTTTITKPCRFFAKGYCKVGK